MNEPIPERLSGGKRWPERLSQPVQIPPLPEPAPAGIHAAPRHQDAARADVEFPRAVPAPAREWKLPQLPSASAPKLPEALHSQTGARPLPAIAPTAPALPAGRLTLPGPAIASSRSAETPFPSAAQTILLPVPQAKTPERLSGPGLPPFVAPSSSGMGALPQAQAGGDMEDVIGILSKIHHSLVGSQAQPMSANVPGLARLPSVGSYGMGGRKAEGYPMSSPSANVSSWDGLRGAGGWGFGSQMGGGAAQFLEPGRRDPRHG